MNGASKSWTSWLAVVALTTGSSIASAQIAFTDVSAAAGVDLATETYGASWGDLNGDGFLDIYASNHRLMDSLYLNRGDGTFVETSGQVLTWINHQHGDTHGGSWSDFDNDGDMDLLISTGTGNPSQFFVNEYGALIDRGHEYGTDTPNIGGRMPVWLDYNGDKLTDFVMTQFGGIARLYRQNATGVKFTETTTAAKLNCKKFHYGVLYDVTSDGRLDFICPEQGMFPQKIYDTGPFPWTKLFDIATPNSLFPIIDQVADSIVADFNNDGRMDMFFLSGVQLRPSSVAQSGANRVEAQLAGGTKGFKFISNGPITIKADWNKADEGTQQSLSKIHIGSTGWHPDAIPFTLDPANPLVAGQPPAPQTTGDLPVMQIGFDTATKRWTIVIQTKLTATGATIFSEAYLEVSTTAPVTSLQSTGLWPSDKTAPPTLLLKTASGYTDATAAAGLGAAIQCASVTAGDFDNDGDQDLFLACSTGANNTPDILYQNNGNGTFSAIPNGGGAAGLVGIAVGDNAGTADTVIAGDYDVDGFLDLFVTNGMNLRPLYFGGSNRLFRNNGNGNHWVEVDLVGTQSDRDAVGARVYATANSLTQLRVQNGQYHRWAQDSRRSHFGLAGSNTVDLRVEWPSGNVDNFAGVNADQLYRITEGSGIAPVALGQAPAYPCGPPTINGSVDEGVFIWKDCPSGEWRMKTASGGANRTFTGSVKSSANFLDVRGIGLSGADTLDYTTNPKQISFSFNTIGSSLDGVNFDPAPGSNSCLKVDAPPGVQVFYGPFRQPVSQPLDLDTQSACVGQPSELTVSPVSVSETAGAAVFNVSLTPSVAQTVTVNYATSNLTATAGSDYTATSNLLTFNPGDTVLPVSVPILDDQLAGEGSETFRLTLSAPTGAVLGSAFQATGTIVDDELSPCGTPTYDPAGVTAAYVWRDCTTGKWFLRFAAGPGTPTTKTFTGSLTADTTFTLIQPFSIEATGDVFTSSSSLVSFSLKVSGTGQDGFNATLPSGSSACFDLTGVPAGAQTLVGVSKTPVPTPFRLDTLGPCS